MHAHLHEPRLRASSVLHKECKELRKFKFVFDAGGTVVDPLLAVITDLGCLEMFARMSASIIFQCTPERFIIRVFLLACWLVGFCCLVFVLLVLSVGVFAGSLGSGCEFPCNLFAICSCLARALELRTALRLEVPIGLMAYWFGIFSLCGFCFIKFLC